MKSTIEVANTLLLNSESEILLLQRSPKLERGYLWGLPGGMIDEGESALQAAFRELKEETSIEADSISVIGIRRFLIEMRDENVNVTSLHAKLNNNTAKVILDPEEHLAYRWAKENDIYSSSNLVPFRQKQLSQVIRSIIDK